MLPNEIWTPPPRSIGQSVRPPRPRPLTLQHPGSHHWRRAKLISLTPARVRASLHQCSSHAHLTHMLLKRNRSSHVKARRVVITPPPPKPARRGFPSSSGSYPASGRGGQVLPGHQLLGNHATTQLPLAASQELLDHLCKIKEALLSHNLETPARE